MIRRYHVYALQLVIIIYTQIYYARETSKKKHQKPVQYKIINL